MFALDKPELLQLLVLNGANLNTTNIDGWTPLMTAIFAGYTNVARYLIDKGADTTLVSHDGRTALNFAQEANNNEIVQLLS